MEMLRSVAMLFVAVVLLLRFTTIHGIYEGVLECEDLTALECAFSVSSAGARCVLEKSTLANGDILPSCQTSMIMAKRPVEWIESDECIQGCGLERETYGLSTDALLESGFVDKLCSAECQNNCPNIMDIYLKLAEGEGVYLSRLCNKQKYNARRLIADPVHLAQNDLVGGGGGGGLRSSSTHVNKNHERPWDSSLASAGTPPPQPSPVYGPDPAPATTPKLKKGKKPVSISPAPSPSPSPVATPSPSPPVDEVSSSRFGDDFEDGAY